MALHKCWVGPAAQELSLPEIIYFPDNTDNRLKISKPVKIVSILKV